MEVDLSLGEDGPRLGVLDIRDGASRTISDDDGKWERGDLGAEPDGAGREECTPG